MKQGRIIAVVVIAFIFGFSLIDTVCAQTFEVDYGSTITQRNVSVPRGTTATFRIDLKPHMPSFTNWRTEWYLGGQYQHTDTTSRTLYPNPSYTRTFSDLTTRVIDAIIFDNNWNVLKTFKWTVSVTVPQGSVRITIEPSLAQTDGARWRISTVMPGVDNGWKTSGTTLPLPGDNWYWVEFNNIYGWDRPDSFSFRCEGGTTHVFARPYVQQYGSVRVNIEPSDARNAGAQWRLTSGPDTGWKNSGATVHNIPVRQNPYTITFRSLSNWITPSNINVNVASNTTAQRTGTYTLEPKIISAYWWERPDEYEGDTATMCAEVQGFPIGTTFSFEVWQKFTFGSNQLIANRQGAVYQAEGIRFFVKAEWQTEWRPGTWGLDPTYYFIVKRDSLSRTSGDIVVRQAHGSVRVNIEPSEARSAGAQWRLTSGPDTGWKNSETTINNLPVSNNPYTITFRSISNWKDPSDISFSVSKNITTERTAVYESLPNLIVGGMVTESPLIEGSSYTLSAQIINSGQGDAGASHAKAWLASDTDNNLSNDYYLGEISVPALSAGASTYVNWTFVMPDRGTGQYPIRFFVLVDSRGVVEESDESNYFMSGDFIAETGVEITILSVPTGPHSRGQHLEASVKVSNKSSSERTLWVGLSFASPESNSWPDGWCDVTPQETHVAAGASKEVLFTFELPHWLPKGDYTAIAAVWQGYNPLTNLMVEPRFDVEEEPSFTIISEQSLDDLFGRVVFSPLPLYELPFTQTQTGDGARISISSSEAAPGFHAKLNLRLDSGPNTILDKYFGKDGSQLMLLVPKDVTIELASDMPKINGIKREWMLYKDIALISLDALSILNPPTTATQFIKTAVEKVASFADMELRITDTIGEYITSWWVPPETMHDMQQLDDYNLIYLHFQSDYTGMDVEYFDSLEVSFNLRFQTIPKPVEIVLDLRYLRKRPSLITGSTIWNEDALICEYRRNFTVYPTALVHLEDFEEISTPSVLGSTSLFAGQSVEFHASAAASNMGSSLLYMFDWGNGTSTAWIGTTASHAYPAAGNYQIRVKAMSAMNESILSEWSGPHSITVNLCNLTLTVSPSGSGSITVSPDRPGYSYGELVQVMAVPSSDWRFTGWSGDATGGQSTRSIVMNGHRAVTALFERIPETISAPGSPSGETLPSLGSTHTYTTSSAQSNLGHSLEYRFNWGDGTSSEWSTSKSASKTWTSTGEFAVTVTARCRTHTDVSNTSDTLMVVVHDGNVPPSIALVSNETIHAGIPYSRTLTLEAGTLPVDWTLVEAPEGMTVESQDHGASAEVHWLAPTLSDGPVTVRIRASNDAGEDVAEWLLTVVADAPVRQFGADVYAPLVPLEVWITVEPSAGITGYAIADEPPTGWSVTEISDDGAWEDDATGEVRWVFLDAEPRTVSYVVTPPQAESGNKYFSGTASYDGMPVNILPDPHEISSAANHPADLNMDWQLTMSEVLSYAVAWKSGNDWHIAPNPIPMDYVTRAIYLWKGANNYHFEKRTGRPPALWWHRGAQPSDVMMMAMLGSIPAIERTAASSYSPGDVIHVDLEIFPAGCGSYAVEDTVPTGWVVSNISHAGVWHQSAGMIRWVFADGDSRTLSYDIQAPAARLRDVTLTGYASFDGRSESLPEATITGISLLEGDANRDCRVDILDLVFVRNRIGRDVNLDDNQYADVNGDDVIDLNDLIFVRNRLGATCQ